MKELLKKIAVYGAIASFALVLVTPAFAEDRTDGKFRVGNDGSVACTMDAKQCPDGTFVGRTGEDCEFVCPGVVTNDNNEDDDNDNDNDERGTSPAMPPTLFRGDGDDRIQIQEKKQEMKEAMEKAREISKQKREEAKDKFEAAREEYKEKVEEAKQDRKEFTASVKEEVKNKGEESRARVVEKAKNMLGNTVSAMVKRLEALKNKVNGIKLLDADKADILAEINKDIDWLNAKIAEVPTTASTTAATASTTAQTIKDSSKEIKAYWETVKVTVKRVSGEILAGRLNYIVNKEEELVNALTTEIATLKAAGKDVATLEQSLADASAKIATAQTKIAEAKAKFMTITNSDLAKSAYEEGKSIIKEASGIVKDVHVALIKVRNGANAINGNGNGGTGTATSTATTTTP